MEKLYDLKEKLCEELEEYARKQDIGAGDLEAARTMLEQREQLNYAQAFRYAPLALGRPVWLLEKILDLAPQVEMCCAGIFERPGDGS